MIIIVLLMGLLLRLVLINQSVWLDEATSILVAKNFDWGDIVHRFSPGDFHPPFYYFLLKVWSIFFGFTETSARLISVLGALITIYTTWEICRNLKLKISPVFPVLPALILAVNPLHIYYSQEARMYSVATMLASLSVLQYIRLETKPSLKNFIILSVLFVLSIYTYYPLIFLMVAVLLHSIVMRKNYKIVFSGIILSFVAFIPWTPIFFSQLRVASSIREAIPNWWNVLGKTGIKSLVLVWVKFLIGRISFYTRTGYMAFVAVASVVPFISLAYSWIRRREISIIWYWMIIPLILSGITGWFGSGFSYFRLIYVLPAFCILISYGLSHQEKPLTSLLTFIVIASGLTSLVIFWINPRYHRENWRDAVGYIESNSSGEKTAAIFINYSQADAFRYYNKDITLLSSRDWQDQALFHIWLFRYAQPIFDPEDKLVKSIEGKGFIKTHEKDFNGVTIWEYQLNQR